MKGILSIQSHVTYGHAGNSSAIFPMQRMGFEVWPIHTVQFSNHTQYPQGWKGRAFSASDISDVVEGIERIDQLKNVEAVLTGYQGSAEQCDAVAATVAKVKQHQPGALYVCDPVMGAPDKGCIVGPGIAEKLIDTLMPMADVIVPNQFELAQFAGIEIHNLADAVEACQIALRKGPKVVLVKHLHSLSEQQFSMMLATGDGYYLAQRPHLDFDRQPVGVGDLISSLFTAGLSKGWTPVDAFQHCHNATYGILRTTHELKEWELQTIAAQQEIATPSSTYPAEPIKL